MREAKKSFNIIVFRLAVFVSICVLLSYAAGGSIFNLKNYEKSQSSSDSSTSTGQLQKNPKSYSNESVLTGKPLPVNNLINEVNLKIPAINNVILAELKNDKQTVVLVDNPQQQNTDVVLVAKGVRTKWIFRFKDSIPCNGKIIIERFGLIIPIVEKEMEMTFAPLKDFTVTCDKGKFNYYVKVVDNLNIAIDTPAKAVKNISNTNTSSTAKPPIKKSSVNSAPSKQNKTDSNTNIKPQESESKAQNVPSEPVETPEPSLAPSSSSSSQKPASNDGDSNTTKEEPKKKGIFDHLFQHH